MHFSVILPAPELSSSEYQEALDVGPPFIDAPDGYEPYLEESNWQVIDRIDVSSQYQRTLQTLVDGMSNSATEMRRVFGDEFDGYRQHRKDQIALIRRGILKREVFVTSTH